MQDIEKAAIFEFHARFCKILSDANRLMIINELGESEISVNELCCRLGLTQSNVSKHLAMMREQGLVVTRRDGLNIYYRMSDPRISEAIQLLVAAQADQLEKRRALVARGT